MMHLLCQHPACSSTAAREVKAEGTTYSYVVCSIDVGWAKQQIQKDLPGRRIVAKSLSGF
ncbi:hypothetical protein ACFYUR_16670 [Micromonospora haikouensis]|uniref:hypothetical protein n=1 Tax=Micromonospora haikouensis TaxID=686309 RepID=UPI003699B3BC